MSVYKGFFGLAALSIAAACVSPDVIKGARISCGIVDVLVKEADLGKFAIAFAGDDSVGAKVCKAILDDGIGGGVSEPADIPLGERAVTLPDGEIVTVSIVAPA